MNAETFKSIFLPLHPKLYRIAYALVENKADAEDILQDAYYKLWQQKEKWNELRNPEAFCITIVKNLCLDFLRSPQAKQQKEDISKMYTLSGGSSPEQRLLEQEHLKQVAQLIKLLPKDQRLILRLKAIESCSTDEIEQITGLSAANIRVLHCRARKFIREQFEKLKHV